MCWTQKTQIPTLLWKSRCVAWKKYRFHVHYEEYKVFCYVTISHFAVWPSWNLSAYTRLTFQSALSFVKHEVASRQTVFCSGKCIASHFQWVISRVKVLLSATAWLVTSSLSVHIITASTAVSSKQVFMCLASLCLAVAWFCRHHPAGVATTQETVTTLKCATIWE